MMRIQQIRAIHGPNVVSHNPVLVMRLDLGDLSDRESYDIPGFVDRLIEALPGIHEHHCGLGRPGGFVERLRGGTYFGHIVEHVCLELTDRAGISVNRGKTIAAGAPNLYDVYVEFKSEHGMKRLLEIAVEFVQSLVNGGSYALDEKLAEVQEIVRECDLGPSTRALLDAAEKRGIPWTRLGDDSLVQLGYGRHRRFLQAAMASGTSAIAVDTASDKSLTKVLLSRAGVPAPEGRVVRSAEEAVAALEEIGAPVAIKPLDANQGKGVSLDLWTAEQATYAYEIAAQFSKRVVVEQMLHGRDYRVLVVNGRVIAACERIPARVVGDGQSTIEELIEHANRDPRRGDGHSKPMSTIRIDRVSLAALNKQGFHLGCVPPEGFAVHLRENANLSTGGSAVDVTDRVHPSMALICERAARAVGLDICGVDLVVDDISAPFTAGGVVELNAAPGIRMHHFPSEGQPRDVASEIIRMLYPEGNGRVPIVSITGTNGKTTVTRLIAHILAAGGCRVGMTTTDGIWIAGRKIASGDTTGPRSAATVLFDPEVDLAVLETARGGIVRNGLGYDWSDVAVMTNIGPDHIGQDGIETVEDILRIKSLVAERVREDGALVLNADDALLRGVPQQKKVARVRKNVVWFAFDASNPRLKEALRKGATVYYVDHDEILEASGDSRRRIMNVAEIPLTLGGVARFQIANAMAAVAACRAMGRGVAQIRAGLRSFEPGEQNPARANLFELGGKYVLFDYGHNSAAFDAICAMAASWPSPDRICVLGVPGDRADHIIREAGRAAARGFDRFLVKEDVDRRGREPGEVIRLLVEGVRAERLDAAIEVVPAELEALGRALDELPVSGLAVIFCDDCDTVRHWLEERGATAVSSFDAGQERARVA
jgi:cyanophycin synthetase